MKFKLVMAVAAILFLSSTAYAATIDFGTGPIIASTHSSLDFSAEGITVTASAPGEQLSYYWEGIGVYTGGLNLKTLQNNETMQLTFDQTVRLDTISFRQWENGFDEVIFFESSAGNVTLSTGSGGLVDTFDMGGLVLDSFTLTGNSGVTAVWVNGIEVQAVPLPPAFWLLGSGLIGLVGIRRKFMKH